MNLSIQSISYIKYIKIYSVYNTCLHLKPPILILAYYLTYTYIYAYTYTYTYYKRLLHTYIANIYMHYIRFMYTIYTYRVYPPGRSERHGRIPYIRLLQHCR